MLQINWKIYRIYVSLFIHILSYYIFVFLSSLNDKIHFPADSQIFIDNSRALRKIINNKNN